MQSFVWESGEVKEFYFVLGHFILFCYLWGAFMFISNQKCYKDTYF
jgi:hypothetical protein